MNTENTERILMIESPQEMLELGHSMAKQASHILLYGELGAGKTLFTKGFVEGLGLDSYKVQSPTYTYFHNYDEKVLHMDMYRLAEPDYFVNKGMLQSIDTFDYVLIERPKFEDMYAKGYTIVRIEKTGETSRKVVISKFLG